MEKGATPFPIKRISCSSLTCYESCPLQFKFSYIDKVPIKIRTNAAAAFGQAIHKVIEDWYLDGELTRMNLISRWQETFDELLLHPDVEKPDARYKSYLVNRGFPMLQTFFARQKEEGFCRPLDCEMKFEIPWESPHGKIILTGRIDTILSTPEGVHIIDYKTSKTIPTQEQVHKDVQLTFYSAGYRWVRRNNLQKYPELEKKVILYYLAADSKIESVRGKEDYDKLMVRVGKVLDGVSVGKYDANPSSDNCKWCNYTEMCPAFVK